MRIAFLVRILMMDAMRSDPGNGAAFERERPADSQEILHPLGSLVAAVGEQAMIAHADPEAAGNPPHDDGQDQCFPGEEEDSAKGREMKPNHDEL